MEGRRAAREPAGLHRPRTARAGNPRRLCALHRPVMSAFEQGGPAASIASVTDKVRPLALGAPVTSVHFLGDRAAFVGAEESVFVADGQGEVTAVAAHRGGILCAVSDGSRIVMGGDDGRLVALDAKGAVSEL